MLWPDFSRFRRTNMKFVQAVKLPPGGRVEVLLRAPPLAGRRLRLTEEEECGLRSPRRRKALCRHDVTELAPHPVMASCGLGRASSSPHMNVVGRSSHVALRLADSVANVGSDGNGGGDGGGTARSNSLLVKIRVVAGAAREHLYPSPAVLDRR